jgi:L-ascorbate metabolism protein UlaG (beta-lactamase superfamily)
VAGKYQNKATEILENELSVQKMELKWFGQSCFYLTSSAGTHILMDPCARWFGYRMPQVKAEAVTTSHTHYDHHYLQMVDGDFIHIDAPGTHQVKDISIHGMLSWHDASRGVKRGRNIIFTFWVDGLTICHLGDLGHLLTPEQVTEIGKVDVLLLPVGGTLAISVPEAVEVQKQLPATVTIPMHYRTRALGLGGMFFAPLDKFLSKAGQPVRRLQAFSLQLPIPADQAGVVVLNYE